MDLKQKSKELGFISRINLVHENLKSPDMGKLELLLYFLWMTELQKWLREVHNIHINPIPYNVTFKTTVYRCRITYFENEMEQNKYRGLSIYEESLEIGLQEALKLTTK